MLFPISDDNDEGYRHWYDHPVHYFFIFLCFIVFCLEIYVFAEKGQAGLKAFVDEWAFDPPNYLGSGFLALSFGERVSALLTCLGHLENRALLRMLSSTFLHGSPAHLLGNMLILWMLGDNVEYAMGSFRYLVFFLLAGILSVMGFVLLASGGNFAPEIGASGAIMAVAGAYWVYFPRAEINFFYFFVFWWGIFSLRARLVLAFLFLSDAATTWFEYHEHHYGNVAVGAHVSGFLFGVLLSIPFNDKPLYQSIARPVVYRSLASKLRKADDGTWGSNKRD